MNKWLRRQRYLADYTLSALSRRRTKNIGLVTLYAAIVFVVASAMMFAAALKREAELTLRDAPELTVQRLVMGRHDLIFDDYIEKIAGIRGVASAKGRLWSG